MLFLLFLLPISLGLINVPGDYVSISAAVNASSDGEIILISQGKFDGAENCGVLINKPLILKGAGPAKTIVDCGGTGSRCLAIENVAGQLVIDGIQFANGISPQLYLPKTTTTTTTRRESSEFSGISKLKYFPQKKGKDAVTTIATDDWTPIATLMLTPQGLVLVPNVIRETGKCCERERKEKSMIAARKKTTVGESLKTAKGDAIRIKTRSLSNAGDVFGKATVTRAKKRESVVQQRTSIKVQSLSDAADAGGCILAVNVQQFTLSNVWINGGQAGRRGGGMAIIGSENVIINDCDISNNKIIADTPTVKDVGGVKGGGLMITDAMQTWISSTKISQNVIAISGTSPANYDTALGAGMYCSATSAFSTVLVNASLASNNSIFSSGDDGGNLKGGGIYLEGGIDDNNTIIVLNSSIMFNAISASSRTLFGGGLSVECSNSNLVKILSSSIISNTISGSGMTLGSGGGMYIYGNNNNQLTVLSSSIISNTISGSGTYSNGGGVYMEGNKNNAVAILSSSIVSNTISASGTTLLGGGVLLEGGNSNNLTISSSSIFSNTISGSATTVSGGGIYLEGNSDDSFLTVSSSSIIFNTISGSGANLNGGGIFIKGKNNRNTLSIALSSIMSNAISGSGSFSEGAGIYMLCNGNDNILSVSSSSIVSNTISGSGARLNGAGLYCLASSEKNSLKIADACFIGNAALDQFMFSFADISTLNAPIAESNVSFPCSGSTILKSSSGLISDGSGNSNYVENQKCSFSPQITEKAFRQSNAVFALRFRALDLEKNGDSACYDYVSIYDGSSSTAPLIGVYCGTMIKPVCASGLCPSPNDTFTTSQSDFLILFSSDSSENLGGFEIAYTAADAPSLSTVQFSKTALLRSADLFDLSNSSIGGGLCIDGPFTASVDDCHFYNNSVRHWLTAAGGGITVLSTGSGIVKLSSIYLVENSARSGGYIASGGGLASIAGTVNCTKTVTFSRNQVYATGACWNQLDVAGWSCPTALGGGVVAMSGGTIVISNIDSSVVANKAQCSVSSMAERVGQPCLSGGGAVACVGQESQIIISSGALTENNTAARGGGVFVTDSGVVRLQQNATCMNNVADCNLVDNAIGCQSSAGGCGYVDSGEVRFLDGALIATNRANEGGGVYATNDGKIVASDSFFVKNYADVMGGALMAYSRASIFVDGGVFDMNNASRATVLAAMNDDGSSRYSFTGNASIDGANGSMAIAAGPWIGLDNRTRWQCAHEGSYFRMDASSQGFFSMECDVCSSGSYAVGKAMGVRECLPCPYGAACGQSNATWNGLRAVGGFWGREIEGEALFLSCPSGYCCPIGKNCTFNYCGGGREGLLCSQCPPGTGLAYFTTGCVPSETCNDLKWVLPVAFIAAIVMALWLLKTTGAESSGLIAVLLFFYQISPVVKSTPWQHIAPEAIGVVQAIFQVSAPDVSGEGGDSNNYESSSPSRAGVCIVSEMTASQKLGSRLLFQALVFLAIIVVAVLHVSLHHLLPRLVNRPPSWKALYVPAIVRFLTIAYLTLVLVPLQMIQCVRIDGEQKWWWDAQVKCFESWQVGALVGICILSPIPLLMIWISKNQVLLRPVAKKGNTNDHRRRERGQQRAALDESFGAVKRGRGRWLVATDAVLCNGFREERRWWLGVSLYRRLIVVVIFTAIEDSNWRSIAMTCCLCLFLLINLIMKPFKNVITHRAETGSLLILCFLCALTSPQLSKSQFGTNDKIYDEKSLEIVQMTLLAIPIVCYVGFQLWQLVRERFFKRIADSPQSHQFPTPSIFSADIIDRMESSSSFIEGKQSGGGGAVAAAHCAICEWMEKDSTYKNNNNDDGGDLMAVMLDILSEEEQEEALRCELHEFC